MSEFMVTMFRNSADKLQIVTEGPDATCPECGYPERHRIYDGEDLTADGCPSCETSRMIDRTTERCECVRCYLSKTPCECECHQSSERESDQ